MAFTVEIEGLDELERDLGVADEELRGGVVRATQRACVEGADEARRTHRFQNQTGALERSIAGYTVTAGPGFADGVIEATAPHASYLEEGTRPHVIHARAAFGEMGPLREGQTRAGKGKTAPGLLTFQIDGRWIAKRSVQHPGTQPDGFMGRAYLKAERVLEREVEVAAARAEEIVNR